ncbi:hypothetical protein [uncultured Corynebacterium sp.]|uniref:hypothetical protein n=1 Tax=uncultured Corynebacterium sp. TaxID=159447 RepID=UPI00288A7210|nr:hypothetical protein [uncultured Corynebacterium sp.]
MKAKLMAGALAVGLVAPLTVVAGPSAFGEEETVSASMAERLNPRLNASFIVLGTNSNSTIIREDMADDRRYVRSIKLKKWDSPYDVKVTTGEYTYFGLKTEKLWVEPVEDARYPSRFEIDFQAEVTFSDGSSGLFPGKFSVSVASKLVSWFPRPKPKESTTSTKPAPTDTPKPTATAEPKPTNTSTPAPQGDESSSDSVVDIIIGLLVLVGVGVGIAALAGAIPGVKIPLPR